MATEKKNMLDDFLDTMDAGLSGLESAMGAIRNSDDSDDVPDPMEVAHASPRQLPTIDVTPTVVGIPTNASFPRVIDAIKDYLANCPHSDERVADVHSQLSLDIALVIWKVL